MSKKSLEIIPGHNESYSFQKPSLQDPSWLRGVCTAREGPGVGQVWKRKPDNWPEGRQRP